MKFLRDKTAKLDAYVAPRKRSLEPESWLTKKERGIKPQPGLRIKRRRVLA